MILKLFSLFFLFLSSHLIITLKLYKRFIYILSYENASIELPLLTFNSLYNILREEKRVKSLQKLPEGFYEALEKFIDDKKTEIKKLKENLEEKDKLMKEKNIF